MGEGVDPHLAEDAARLCSQLFAELAGAGLTGESDVSAELPQPAIIHLHPERASALLGLEVAPDEQRQVLEALGFEVSSDWNVTVPTWRGRDVTREVDLIEEVGRMKLDDAVHTSRAPGDVRPAHSLAAAAARRRGRPRGPRLLRGVRAQPRGRRPGLGRLSDPAAPVAGHGRAAHDAPPEPHPGRAPQPRRRERAHRAIRDCARLSAERRRASPTSASMSQASRRLHTRVPRAQSKRILAAGRAVGTFTRGEHPLPHPGQTATTTGGILGGLRPGILEGDWARSSSTSAPSTSRRSGRTRTSSPIRRSSRTLPLPCPTRCSRRIWWKLHGRPCRSSGRWSPSTSIEATRSARGASRSRSESSSARRSARSRTRRPRVAREDRRGPPRAFRRRASA